MSTPAHSLLRTALLAAALASLSSGSVLRAEFVPPTAEERLAALGPLDDAPAGMRRLLMPDDDFPPIEAPSPGDWLDAHEEPGQPFAEFVATDAQRATEARHVIYLQPLGEFSADSAPSLEALRDYAQAFFQLDVVLLPAEVYESAAFEPRIHPRTGKPQLRTTAVLLWLRDRLPDDAFCLIGVTMQDLYPDPSWNFVFGQAWPAQRTGIFSFARSDPLFFGDERPEDFDALLLSRSNKTLVHEIAHILGLGHCTYFRCVENGSNHQQESDSRPHHLCPVCLRKLQYATGADLEQRYRDLAYFYSQHPGWEREEAWVRRQLAKLRAPQQRPPVLTPPMRPSIAPPAAPSVDLPRPTVPNLTPPDEIGGKPSDDVPASEINTMPPVLPPSPPAPKPPTPDEAPPPLPTPNSSTEPLVA